MLVCVVGVGLLRDVWPCCCFEDGRLICSGCERVVFLKWKVFVVICMQCYPCIMYADEFLKMVCIACTFMNTFHRPNHFLNRINGVMLKTLSHKIKKKKKILCFYLTFCLRK